MKKLKKFLKNDFFILGTIIIFGFILRVYNLKDNFIFAYDQARDAQRIWEIFYERNLKIVGPETDIPGVFNGPLLYYLLLPLYLISGFNPNLPALFFTILNLLNIILIYLFSLKILKNKTVGLLASFLWAISYLQLNFSKYISNASLMSFSSGIFFIGLALFFVKNNKSGLLLSALGIASAIHFNFYLTYLIIFLPILSIIFNKRIKLDELKRPIILFLLLTSNFIIAEYKWKFMASRSLISYLISEKEKNTIFSNLQMFFDRLGDSISLSFFSFNIFLGFLLFLLFLLFLKKNSSNKAFIFILIWFLSTLPLFGFRSGVLYGHVVNTTIYIPLTIITAVGLYYVLKISKFYFLIFIFFMTLSNFYLIYKDNFNNTKLLASKPIILKDALKIIDYSYIQSNTRPFSICAVTEPLFINTLWSFLYKFYGEKKYGYLPYWSGPKQFLNRSFLEYDYNKVENRFLIIENQAGIPPIAIEATLYAENKISKVIDEKNFGNFTIQKRQFLRGKSYTEINNNLEKILNDSRYSCNHYY